MKRVQVTILSAKGTEEESVACRVPPPVLHVMQCKANQIQHDARWAPADHKKEMKIKLREGEEARSTVRNNAAAWHLYPMQHSKSMAHWSIQSHSLREANDTLTRIVERLP